MLQRHKKNIQASQEKIQNVSRIRIKINYIKAKFKLKNKRKNRNNKHIKKPEIVHVVLTL